MIDSAKRGKLIVASNRLPVTVRRSRSELKAERSSGGLVAAMEPAMQRMGGIWIGWPGIRLKPGEEIEVEGAGFGTEAVTLSPTDVKRFYHGFSNGVLWPLFHSLPERMLLDPKNWDSYESVNQRFADAIGDDTRPLDSLRAKSVAIVLELLVSCVEALVVSAEPAAPAAPPPASGAPALP